MTDSPMTLSIIDRTTALVFIRKRHYAVNDPQVTLAFGWYRGDVLEAVCTFGKPASPQLCRMCGDKYEPNVFELNRLVRNEGLEFPLSMFVGSILRELKKRDWIVVSYADTGMNHTGYIYQSCNFIYTGISEGNLEKVVITKNGTLAHSRHGSENDKSQGNVLVEGLTKIRSSKHRYIYFCTSDKKLKREWKSLLKYPVLPYPKGVNKNYVLGEKHQEDIVDSEGNKVILSKDDLKEKFLEENEKRLRSQVDGVLF